MDVDKEIAELSAEPAKPKAKKASKPKAKKSAPKKKAAAKPKAKKKPAKVAKRKPGKPKVKPATLARPARLDLRLTVAEKAKIMAKAKKSRRTVTSVVLEMIEKLR